WRVLLRSQWLAPVVAPHGCSPFHLVVRGAVGGLPVSPSRCAAWVLLLPVVAGGVLSGWWLAPVVAPHGCSPFHLVVRGAVGGLAVSPSRCAAWVLSFSSGGEGCCRGSGGQPQSLRRMGALLFIWW